MSLELKFQPSFKAAILFLLEKGRRVAQRTHESPGTGGSLAFRGAEFKGSKDNEIGDHSAVSMINFMYMISDCVTHEAGQGSQDGCSDPEKFHSIRDDSFSKVLSGVAGGP